MRRLSIGRRVAVAVILLLVGCAAAPATSWRDEKPRPDPAGPYPDRIILTWNGDPATSQAVSWRTDATTRHAAAQIVRDAASPDCAVHARTLPAATTRMESEQGPVLYHSLTFTDLEPGQVYRYRVGSERGWSEWFRFRTAMQQAEPFRFLYLGDAQNAILPYWAPLLRAAYAHAPDACFILHAGDLVSHCRSDAEWGEWFRAGGWIHASLPSLPAAGNHDYGKLDGGVYTLTPYWRRQFALPANGPWGLDEAAYFIDYQALRVIVLDSNTRLAEQAQWLRRVLSTNPNRWTVLTFHHPIRSATRDRDNPEVRAHWQPIFDEYAVDLVLQGHDHAYARGRIPAAGHRAQAPPGNPVYVVSVSGPKMYEPTPDRWMQRAGTGLQFYQVISITPDTLRFEAFTLAGELYDAFDLVKRPGDINKLIERLPLGTPERFED